MAKVVPPMPFLGYPAYLEICQRWVAEPLAVFCTKRRARGGGAALGVDDQAAPLVDESEISAAERIENPVLMRKRGVGCVGERQAGRFGQLGAGQAVAGGAVAQAVGAVGEIEEDLVLALPEGEAGWIKCGLAVAGHGR